MARKPYKWSIDEKTKLINRYSKYGWQPKQYQDFKCTVATCKAELIRLGYIRRISMDKVFTHGLICAELTEIYEAKNKDYGNSFTKRRKEYGNVAILIRLDDKLERLKTLMLSGEQQVKTESIEDTLKDLANYAIMELVEREIEKEGEKA